MNMRERMAQAMMAEAKPDLEWDDLMPETQDAYRRLADAALSAMAEPTDEMWEAGYRSDYFPGSTWRAMIGAAGEG
jgi:hypothetical protein